MPKKRTVKMFAGFVDGRMHAHGTWGVTQAELFKFRRDAREQYEDVRPVLVTYTLPQQKRRGK